MNTTFSAEGHTFRVWSYKGVVIESKQEVREKISSRYVSGGTSGSYETYSTTVESKKAWLKLENGEERELDLSDTGLSFREGHTLEIYYMGIPNQDGSCSGSLFKAVNLTSKSVGWWQKPEDRMLKLANINKGAESEVGAWVLFIFSSFVIIAFGGSYLVSAHGYNFILGTLALLSLVFFLGYNIRKSYRTLKAFREAYNSAIGN